MTVVPTIPASLVPRSDPRTRHAPPLYRGELEGLSVRTTRPSSTWGLWSATTRRELPNARSRGAATGQRSSRCVPGHRLCGAGRASGRSSQLPRDQLPAGSVRRNRNLSRTFRGKRAALVFQAGQPVPHTQPALRKSSLGPSLSVRSRRERPRGTLLFR